MAINQPPGLAATLVGPLLAGLAAMSGLPPATPAWAASPVPRAAAAETDSANAVDGQQLDDLDTYRLALLRMKAHLAVARDLARQRVGYSGEHMHGPLNAILQANLDAFKQRGALVDDAILKMLAAAAESESPQARANAIETAQTAVQGSIARSGKMTKSSSLKLARALYHAAVADYGQAVSGNSVVKPMGYRSGLGFVTVAESLLRRSGAFTSEGVVTELRQAALLLREAWPGATPPQIATNPSDVTQWLARLDAAIEPVIEQQKD